MIDPTAIDPTAVLIAAGSAGPVELAGPTLVLVHLLIVLGMVVVVPLGLALLEEPSWVRRGWVPAAALGAVALWLPRGAVAVALAAAYALACLVLAVRGAQRLWRWWRERRPLRWSTGPRALAEVTALATPAVAGLSLVAERGGVSLLGFDLGILTLTVAHFHFAGFAAALVAGLLCRAATDSAPDASTGTTVTGVTHGRLARWVACSVPGGTLLVLIGYFTGEWVELAGAAVLTAGMWGVGWLIWTRHLGRAGDRLTRALLATSAIVLVATMALALSWALGQATGLPHPSLGVMAATHGMGNALGFALCGLLAWRRLARSPGLDGSPCGVGR